jgi:hypothetical protein
MDEKAIHAKCEQRFVQQQPIKSQRVASWRESFQPASR